MKYSLLFDASLTVVHHCWAGGSMRTCHAAVLGSIPVGTSFLGEVFSGFSSLVKQMSGIFRPTRSPNIIWPSESSFHIRLVRMNGWVDDVYRLSYSCCHGGGPGIELIPPCPWSKKYVCDPELIPSPDSSWLCNVLSKTHCKPLFLDLGLPTLLTMYVLDCLLFVKRNPDNYTCIIIITLEIDLTFT